MNLGDFLKIALSRKKTVLSVTALVFVLFLAVTFIQPLKYRAVTKILITQSYSSSADAYVISRSNQFISNVLSQVIDSDLFLQDVLSSGFNIDKNIFSSDSQKRQKQWSEMNKSVVVNDSGILIIYTYHKDRYQAFQINQAIAYVLKTKHNLYHGLGDKVVVKILDKSIISRFPVKPNVLVNSVLGLFFGFILGLFVSFLKTQETKRKVKNIEEVVSVGEAKENYISEKVGEEDASALSTLQSNSEQASSAQEKEYQNNYDDYGEEYTKEEDVMIASIGSEQKNSEQEQERVSVRDEVAEVLDNEEKYEGGRLEEEKIYDIIKDFKGDMSNVLRQ